MSSKAKLSSPENNSLKFEKNTDERLLTKKEIADFLSVSIKMIDRKVMLKEIPFFKIGRLVRFSKREVIEWMQKGPSNGAANGNLLRQ